MNKKLSCGVLLATLLLACGVAPAATIGNGPPNQTGGSDLDSFLEGDNFSIAAPTVVTQIKFWALLSSQADYTGSIDWAFYSDFSGFPDTSVASGNASPAGTATGNSAFGLDEYSYTFAVNTPLTAGAYWLVLHNGPSNAQPATTFYWEWSADTGDSAGLDLFDPSAWTGNFSELAFELTTRDSGSVPEPVSASLVGGGLIAAWMLSRKRKGARS